MGAIDIELTLYEFSYDDWSAFDILVWQVQDKKAKKGLSNEVKH